MEVIIGTYLDDAATSGTFYTEIDNDYSADELVGYFVGRYNDTTIDQCCDPFIDLGNDQDVCDGDTWPILDITDQIGENHGITWFEGNTVVQNGGTVYTPNAIGTYSVYVNYSSDCAGYGIITISDKSCCDQQIDLGEDIGICEDEPWPILDITGQTEGIVSILWFYSEVPFAVASDVETYTTTGEGTYTVKVTFENGCVVSSSVEVFLRDCNCDISPKISMKQKACYVQFSANGTIAGAGVTITGYAWDFGDGATAVGENVSHAYELQGTYNVTLTVYGIDKNGYCCSTAIQRQVNILKACNEGCLVKAFMTSNAIANQVYLFTSSPFFNASTTIIGYEWTIDGVVVSTEEYMVAVITGKSTVCLTVYGIDSEGDCCESKVCKIISPSPGLNTDRDKTGFKAFPNPAEHKINLDFKDFITTQGWTEITVYDALGIEMYATSTEDTTYEIDIKSWKAGIYFCRIEQDGVFAVEKIVKAER